MLHCIGVYYVIYTVLRCIDVYYVIWCILLGPLLSQFVSILILSVKHCSANERSESLKCLGRLGSSFVTNSLSASHLQPSLVDQKLSNLTREYGGEADQRDFIILSHVIHYLLHDRLVIVAALTMKLHSNHAVLYIKPT